MVRCCECIGNVLDDCGVGGGDVIEDDDWDCAGKGVFACGCDEPDTYGCDNTCGSTLENDDCNICDGPGAIYECGCTDIPAGDCDCNGNVLDECGVCGENGHSDNCGICDDNPVNDCVADCAGTWGGIAVEDDCDICVGDNSTCMDCHFTVNGLAFIDGCGETRES